MAATLSDEGERIAALKTPFEDRPAPLWRVWKCIEDLLDESGNNDAENGSNNEKQRKNRMMEEPYRSTTIQVASILQKWALKWAGEETWNAVLHKRKLQNEAEESIVALYYLHQWMSSSQDGKKFIAVDVCGGKGFFSMLLSYMASEFWYASSTSDDKSGSTGTHKGLPWRLDKIVLLEKAKIDWKYIHEANERVANSNNQHIPTIEIWSNTNLHEYDDLLTKFQALCSTDDTSSSNHRPLALTGIHLCKMLSPSLLNLANGLGKTICPYLCVAPCCMPRMVTSTSKDSCRTIPIHLFETNEERLGRLDHNRRKLASRRGRTCFLCHNKGHWVRKCPQMKDYTEAGQDEIVAKAAAITPCWNCGELGHLKPDCPTPQTRILKREPPTVTMDVSEVLAATTDKYEKYCALLCRYIESSSEQTRVVTGSAANTTNAHNSAEPHNGDIGKDKGGLGEPQSKKPKNNGAFTAQVIETGLTASGMHQEGNWNSRRKSIFIVAAR